MKTFTIHVFVKTDRLGSKIEEDIEVEVADDATTEEIEAAKEKEAKEWMYDQIDWAWKDKVTVEDLDEYTLNCLEQHSEEIQPVTYDHLKEIRRDINQEVITDGDDAAWSHEISLTLESIDQTRFPLDYQILEKLHSMLESISDED